MLKVPASRNVPKPTPADNEILPSGLRKLSTEGKSSDEVSNLLCGILTNHRTLAWNDMSLKTQVNNDLYLFVTLALIVTILVYVYVLRSVCICKDILWKKSCIVYICVCLCASVYLSVYVSVRLSVYVCASVYVFV